MIYALTYIYQYYIKLRLEMLHNKVLNGDAKATKVFLNLLNKKAWTKCKDFMNTSLVDSPQKEIAITYYAHVIIPLRGVLK